MPQRIVVLNDGETFSGSKGCVVVDIPDFGLAPEELDLKAFIKDNPAHCTIIDELMDRVDDMRDKVSFGDLPYRKGLLKDVIMGGVFKLALTLTADIKTSAEELLDEALRELSSEFSGEDSK